MDREDKMTQKSRTRRVKLEQNDSKDKNIKSLIWLEVILILFPFAIMVLIFVLGDRLDDVVFQSEWSLATSVLAAQMVVKFLSGVISSNRKKEINSAAVALYVVVIILLLLAFPMFIFAYIQFSPTIPLWLAYTQVLLFFIGILAYMVFAKAGLKLSTG